MVNATTHGSSKRDEYPATALAHPWVIALKSNDASLSSAKKPHRCQRDKLKGSDVPHRPSARTIRDDIIREYARTGGVGTFRMCKYSKCSHHEGCPVYKPFLANASTGMSSILCQLTRTPHAWACMRCSKSTSRDQYRQFVKK